MKSKVKEKCYVYNIFTTNHRWLVIIGYNLNLSLKLLFCLHQQQLVTTYHFGFVCENIMDITFLKIKKSKESKFKVPEKELKTRDPSQLGAWSIAWLGDERPIEILVFHSFLSSLVT